MEAPLLGRDDEFDLLVGGLDDVCEGASRSFVIAGPAGIGKTKLVRAFLNEARGRDCVFVIARGLDGFDLPFGALRAPLAAMGIAASGSDEKIGRTNWLTEEAVRLAEEVIAAANDETPIIIVLEDAHWADEGDPARARIPDRPECRRERPDLRSGDDQAHGR